MKTNILYWFTWLMSNLLFRGLIKTAHHANQENLLKGKPIILAANHTNAFLDAIVLSINSTRSFHYLVRGDVFKKPVANFFLRAWHQFPIFRKQNDGRDSISKNEEVFNVINKLISKNKIIMIFPEGNCVPYKKLRPLKKGTARMAFGFMDEFDWEKDLQVVPVSINYTEHTKFQTSLYVKYNNPIKVSDYNNEFKENPINAINRLTQDISKGIQENLIEVENKIEPTIEFAFKIIRNRFTNNRFKWFYLNSNIISNEQNISSKISHLNQEHNADFVQLDTKLSTYFGTLKSEGLTDYGIAQADYKYGIKAIWFLWYPLFYPGVLLGRKMLSITNNFIKAKIKDPQFISSIRFGFLIMFNVLISLISLLLFIPLKGFVFGLLSVVTLYVYQYLTARMHYSLNDYKAITKANKSSIINDLKIQRAELEQIIDSLD